MLCYSPRWTIARLPFYSFPPYVIWNMRDRLRVLEFPLTIEITVIFHEIHQEHNPKKELYLLMAYKIQSVRMYLYILII